MVKQGRLQNWAQRSEAVRYLLLTLSHYYEGLVDILREV